MKYYLLKENIRLDECPRKRWKFDRLRFAVLDENGDLVPGDGDNWNLIDPPAGGMEPCTYPIDLHRDGVKTDFNLTMDPGNIPILGEKAKNALAGLPEIEEPYSHVVLEPVLGRNDPIVSIYDFMRDMVGYDLADFFERNSETLKIEVDSVLRNLLTPDG